MKTVIALFLLCIVLSCKDKETTGIPPLSPKEPFGTEYQILLNHSLKATEYANGYKDYRVEKGTNKAVVIFTAMPGADRVCCDNGSPYIAFEIDPSLISFEYSTNAQLTTANSITGMTNSFFGPHSYVLNEGTLSGKKLSSKEWSISISLPPKTNSFYNGLTLKELFRVY
jgi:hypothetical protein